MKLKRFNELNESVSSRRAASYVHLDKISRTVANMSTWLNNFKVGLEKIEEDIDSVRTVWISNDNLNFKISVFVKVDEDLSEADLDEYFDEYKKSDEYKEILDKLYLEENDLYDIDLNHDYPAFEPGHELKIVFHKSYKL